MQNRKHDLRQDGGRDDATDDDIETVRAASRIEGVMSRIFKSLAMSLLALAPLFAADQARAEDRDPDTERLERFEKEVDEHRSVLGIPGLSAVIVKNQAVLWAKGFGFADIEGRIPATPDTVYHVASFTKPIAATLVMQLVEQGKLDLDEPVSHYSGDFNDDSIRVKHLLSHTSAGLLATVLDMARFDIAIDRHVLLTRATQEQAWTPILSTGGERLPYGLGWFIEDQHGVRLILHTGHWGTGFSGIYVKVPEKNLSLLLFSNSEALADHQYLADERPVAWVIQRNVFACSFLRLFVSGSALGDCERSSEAALASWKQHRLEGARIAVKLRPEALDPYVGQYRFETFDRVITVTRDGARLFVDIPRTYRTEMFPESGSRFFLKTDPMLFTFVKKSGLATHVDVLDGGETLRANRIE